MSEELFEKYVQNALTEEEKRELSEILSRAEGKRAFAEFVQEWSLLGSVSREMAASASGLKPRVRESAPSSRRFWGGWVAGLAAGLLFALGLIVATRPDEAPSPRMTRLEPRKRALPPVPDRRPEPVSEKAPEPVPVPRKPVVAPAPKPEPPPVRIEAPPAVRTKPVERPAVPAPKPAPPPPLEKTAPKPASKGPRETVVAVAKLIEVRGDVRLRSKGAELAAAPGMPILADQVIRSAADGRAVVQFPDKTTLEIFPGTTVTGIAERVRSGRTPGGKRVDLAEGVIAADVRRQPTGRPMVLRTDLAEATVLGTQLTFTAERGASKLEVWKGRVRLRRRADGASILVTSGHRAVVAEGAPLRPEIIVLTRVFQDGVAPGPEYAGTSDTHINQDKPDENVGSRDELEADGDETGGKSIWGLIRWDISTIPQDAEIQSVVVTLNVQGVSKRGSGYHMFGVRQPWAESEATWKVYASGRPWRNPGARSSAVDRYSVRVAKFEPTFEGPIAINLNADGVRLVQSWVLKPEQNHGLLIGNNATTDGFTFDARESSKPARRPRLTVTYTLGARR